MPKAVPKGAEAGGEDKGEDEDEVEDKNEGEVKSRHLASGWRGAHDVGRVHVPS